MSAISKNFEIPEIDEQIEDKIARLEKPYQDEEVLRTLYWERGLSTYEVADELGCGNSTVSTWLERLDLGAREAPSMERVERATFSTDERGYEQWVVGDPDGTTTVRVHQLLAIADGADPHKVFDGHDVHHKNGVPWDNRPENLEVMEHAEHARHHREEQLKEQ